MNSWRDIQNIFRNKHPVLHSIIGKYFENLRSNFICLFLVLLYQSLLFEMVIDRINKYLRRVTIGTKFKSTILLSNTDFVRFSMTSIAQLFYKNILYKFSFFYVIYKRKNSFPVFFFSIFSERSPMTSVTNNTSLQ